MLKNNNLKKSIKVMNSLKDDYKVFKVENNQLYLIGMNLESYVEVNIGDLKSENKYIEIKEDTKKLNNAIKHFEDSSFSKVEFNNNGLILQSENKSILVGGCEREFTDKPKYEFVEKTTINTDRLLKSILAVEKTRSKDKTRPALCGIHFNGVDIVALDGYIMGLNTDSGLNIENSFTLSELSVDFLIKTLKEFKNTEINLNISDNHVEFCIKNKISITFKKLEANYINYSTIMNKNIINKTTIENLELKKIKKDIKFLNSISDKMTINIEKEKIEFCGCNDKGFIETKVKIDSDVKGENIAMLLDIDLVQRVLSSIDKNNEFISLGFDYYLQPMYVTTESSKYIVLPMRPSDDFTVNSGIEIKQ